MTKMSKTAGDSPVSSPAGLYGAEFTRLQKQKLQYLLKKGGKCGAITVHVGMPDGNYCTIDPFGRCIWLTVQ